SVHAWSIATARTLKAEPAPGTAVRPGQNRILTAHVSPENDNLISLHVDGAVRVWDMVAGREIPSPLPQQRTWVAVSNSWTRVAAGGRYRDVHIWPLRPSVEARKSDGPRKTAKTAAPTRVKPESVVIGAHTDEVYGLAFRQGDRNLASGSKDGTL